jgi:hypothetical protein
VKDARRGQRGRTRFGPLTSGDCSKTEDFDGITPGTFLETEIIVGMKAGRAFLHGNDAVNVFACDAFKVDEN